MRSGSIAVLNIRSDEITSVIAEKGVNGTFIIKSKYSQPYDGYAEGQMLDKDDFTSAVSSAAENLVAGFGGRIKKLYVGVPCEFLGLEQTDKVLTFSSSKKITQKQLDELEELSLPQDLGGYRVIGCNALYYYLSDKRKLINPIGAVSDSLRARLCFYTCKSGFIKSVKSIVSKVGRVDEYVWVPQNQAELYYLVNRDNGGYSLLFDFGHISSTFSIVCGNGLAFSEAFSIGVAHMAALVMESLSLPYPVAYEFIKKVNLNSRDKSASYVEVNYEGQLYSLHSAELKSLIKEGVDCVCETLETCMRAYREKDFTGKPIMITGEGVGVIRGATEHIASRLVAPVDVVCPPVPYYDRPEYSSLFSILSFVLD